MANYPLKKIQIGSNTYEINGADFVEFYIDAQADYREATTSDIDSVSVTINYTQPDPSEIWSKLNASADNNANVQCSWHPNAFAPSGAEGANLYIINRYPYSASLNSSQDYIFVSEVYEKNNTPYITKIIITADEYNSLSATAEVISLGGGGGGGSSLRTLSIYKNGSEVPFTNLAQQDTVELWDISVPAQPTTLDNTGLANIIKASPVVVKDDTFYGYISSYNTSYKELSLIYANSTQMYALTLSHQWNLNWQVTSNKRLMTQ